MCIQSTSSIIWYCGQGAAIPCSWEGNCRSGVALAMHHRLQGLFPLWGSRPRQGDEHPAYALLWSMAHLPLPADICQRSEWASFVETQSSSSDCVCVSQVRSRELCVGSAPGVAAGSQSPADEPYRCDRWHVVHLRDGRLLLHLPGETMSWLIDWLTDLLTECLATGETAGYLCICQVRQWDLLHLYWLIDLLQVKQLATCASARWDNETLCTCVDWLIDRLAAGETADYLYICRWFTAWI